MKKSLLLAVLLFVPPSAAQAESSFAGTWNTSFGPMTLTQEGKKVRGHYDMEGHRCPINGTVEKNRLTFIYEEPDAKGEGWFELSADGKKFSGKWRPAGTKGWGEWTGTRVLAAGQGFSGLWNTSYGRMRLTDAGERVQGMYGPGGAATIDGKIEGKRLKFSYQEPAAAGEGWFELSADGKSFSGQWRPKGQSAWAEWKGQRVNPVAGRVWLVILEANWENDLNEQEYAFGAMLRAFFARSAKVQVRHRFFTDATSLVKWSKEVAYIAEPVVLVIATHGTPQGVTVSGKTIGASTLANGLRHCDNLKLLHFSACQLMKDRLASEMVRALDKRVAFPISGYTTTVDWAASAIIEFAYFDMILLRGMKVTAAADQVAKLLPFSGDKPIPGGAIPPAGFRLLTPEGETTAGK